MKILMGKALETSYSKCILFKLFVYFIYLFVSSAKANVEHEKHTHKKKVYMQCGLDRVNFCQTFSTSYLPLARFARSALGYTIYSRFN